MLNEKESNILIQAIDSGEVGLLDIEYETLKQFVLSNKVMLISTDKYYYMRNKLDGNICTEIDDENDEKLSTEEIDSLIKEYNGL